MKTNSHILTLITVMVAGLFLAPTAFPAGDAPLPGAIFTTDSTCTAVNQNIFDNKADVYVDGGPAHPGAAGLPDGSYCVQVTDPSGQTVLGKSDPGAVTVVGGEFVQCYQLSSILKTASSGFTVPGFDDTPNPGGEYKVWVSTDCNFDNNSSKTDNFKVQSTTPTPTPTATPTATPTPTPCPKGWVCVTSFYDANANGIQDNGEQQTAGWQFLAFAHDNLHLRKETPKCAYVNAGTYRVLERGTNELNWIHTTLTDVEFDVETDYTEEVNFGNVCIGAGGGLTIGYWSTKNAQQTETRSDFNALTALNLVTAQGTAQDFTGTLNQGKAALNALLLGATTTNMANMLSAELAVMKLNVLHGFVNGSALIYAPALAACGTSGLSPLGFISVNDLTTAANQSLLNHPLTPDGSPDRACQETLKKALEDANNNRNFAQSSPCTFSFGN